MVFGFASLLSPRIFRISLNNPAHLDFGDEFVHCKQPFTFSIRAFNTFRPYILRTRRNKKILENICAFSRTEDTQVTDLLNI
jgi:hypothetical protein